ncbi:hypothetical protein BEP19_01430 [Ammoniphilus oxalaticus]|uniref:DUF4227 domain-containing protein n=1 Tax=Ammoniphilus oxalaticus TaxID=66863 RepID=A0A419SN04_9BACL|nr:DUF4227 family protein [Ammoniphilus oxalaticus]RKD25633.1 hypothetical protein BEP19_01430 [Ammoniphilus oxalaticus]
MGMFISFQRLLEAIKLIVLFFITTFIFFSIISFFSDVIKPSNPYRKPERGAVKVMKVEWQGYAAANMSAVDRLKFFYWFGE